MNVNRLTINNALEFSFLLLVFSLGFMQPFIAFGGFRVPYSDLIFLFVFMLWFAAILWRKTDFRFDWSYIPLALYFLSLLCSSAFSTNLKFSFFKLLGETYLLGLAVMTFNMVRSFEMVKRVIFVWLAATSIACFVSILTVFVFYFDRSNLFLEYSLHHYGSLPPGNYPRIQSTFLYPSMLCNYLTVSLMMLLAAYRLSWIKRNVFWILFVALVIAIAFTITPGIGGVLLGICLWLWLIFKERKKPWLSKLSFAGGLVSVLLFLLVSTFTLRQIPTSPFYFTFFGLRIDPTQRLLTWQSAFQTLLNYPFFGKGLGLGVAEVSFLDPSSNMQFLTDAHQMWLSVAAQSGLFGLAAFSFVCIYVFRRSLPMRFESTEWAVLRVGCGIAFVSAFLYQGLTGSFEDARHLWVLIGLILAANPISAK